MERVCRRTSRATAREEGSGEAVGGGEAKVYRRLVWNTAPGVEVEGMATGRCPKTRHCYCPSPRPLFLSLSSPPPVAPNTDFDIHARMNARMHARTCTCEGAVGARERAPAATTTRARIARLTTRAKYVCTCARACDRAAESAASPPPRVTLAGISQGNSGW